MSSSELSDTSPFHSSHAVLIGSITWGYLRARPAGKVKGTVLLLHGFPDLPYGWKNQVPLFTSLGYQVIAPYMMGYSRTSSPSELEEWSSKKQAAGLAALLDQIVPGEQVILGGHDWGGNIAWRFAMHYPHLFKGIFSVTLPYFPPETEYVDLADDIAAGKYPTFRYRLQWRDQAFDRKFESAAAIRQFLIAVHEGRTPEGKLGMGPEGLDLVDLARLQPSPLLHGAELDRYVAEYHRRGFRGPLNWYRIAKINFEDELPVAQAGGHRFAMPALFVFARRDRYLVPELAKDMGRHFDKLTRADVNTGHWALVENGGKEVNEAIRSWIATLE
ncbi:alpha/beta-hydrolase [Hypoxylon rubiginosum]|uniref:Alpha/beta-hydrolase n=1 Tax=Hypoxylon rubiginosum TaxID=110542 RepID=A0ACB9Z857_9PEZI|nr:alpha/beta-hydrolase [Hypoxylon rubiginosum]